MDRHDAPPWSKRLFGWLERLLQLRYLRELSDEERRQLREHAAFIHRTLVDRRPPRLAIAGACGVSISTLLETIAGELPIESPDVKEYLGRGRWYDYDVRGDTLEILDLRVREDGTPSLQALERREPDTILFCWDPDEPEGDIERLEEIARVARNYAGQTPSLMALVEPHASPGPEAERQLRERLRDSSLPHLPLFVARRDDVRDLVAELVESTPMEARFQFAQIVGASEPKRRIARLIVQSSAGLAAAFATLPLPLADIVPITTTQLFMIAAIGHLGGRQFGLRTVGEFLVAAGVNVGAGYALREVARALVQFLPFAGSTISSGIATGATLALGNAAIAYFVDDEEPAPDLDVADVDANSLETA
jgi:uncharacterized protein (DUF697 family)